MVTQILHCFLIILYSRWTNLIRYCVHINMRDTHSYKYMGNHCNYPAPYMPNFLSSDINVWFLSFFFLMSLTYSLLFRSLYSDTANNNNISYSSSNDENLFQSDITSSRVVSCQLQTHEWSNGLLSRLNIPAVPPWPWRWVTTSPSPWCVTFRVSIKWPLVFWKILQ